MDGSVADELAPQLRHSCEPCAQGQSQVRLAASGRDYVGFELLSPVTVLVCIKFFPTPGLPVGKLRRETGGAEKRVSPPGPGGRAFLFVLPNC